MIDIDKLHINSPLTQLTLLTYKLSELTSILSTFNKLDFFST